MTKKNKEYWKGRFEQLEKASHQSAQHTYSQIEEAFIQAQKETENKINSWYIRFANNNKITIAEAKKMLNSNELNEFKWDVQEYIKYGKENKLNSRWIKELENASAKFHISRLEALKIQTQQSLEKLFGNELDEIEKITSNSYTDNYYHTIFEIQKGFNVGFRIGTIDENKLSKIVNKPWAVDEKNFSERIWGKKTTLINELHKQLTSMCIQCKAPDDVIRYMSKKFNVSKAQAGNLVMTENAYFSELAKKNCFNDLDVERYEIVATLDMYTSDICQEQDGKVYTMKEYETGVTAPPFHNYCRTTTAPYFDKDYDITDTRIARGEDGKTYHVPDNVKYKDWYNKYVKNDLKETIKDAKINTGDKAKQLQDILIEINEARREKYNLDLVSKDDIINSDIRDLAFSVEIEGLDNKVVDAIIDNYKKLGDEYYSTLNHIGLFDKEDLSITGRPNSLGYVQVAPTTMTGEVHFNQKMLNDFDEYVDKIKKCSEIKHISPHINPENYKYYVSTHEFAHSIFNRGMLNKNLIGMDRKIYKNFSKELEKMFEDYKNNIQNIEKQIKELNVKFVLHTENFTKEDNEKLKLLKKEMEETFVSNYATRDNLKDEFMAECFAEAKLSDNPSKTSLELLKLVDKYFKR